MVSGPPFGLDDNAFPAHARHSVRSEGLLRASVGRLLENFAPLLAAKPTNLPLLG